MREITQEEINRTLERFQNFNEADVHKFFRIFQKKQEPLLVYVAAIAEREELNEHEYDVLITMALMTWEVIRSKFPRVKKLSMKQLQKMDDALFDLIEKNPSFMLFDFEDHPQPNLLGTILTHVMEAESEVREDRKGMIFLALKNVVDGLVQVSGES